MPLYDYRCQSCDKTVELLVRSPEASPPCPTCGDEMVRLVSAPVAPRFKVIQRIPNDVTVTYKRKQKHEQED